MKQKIDKQKFTTFIKDLFNELNETYSFKILNQKDQKHGITIFSIDYKTAIHFRVEDLSEPDKIVFNEFMKSIKDIIENTKFSTFDIEKFIIISTYKDDSLIFEYTQMLKTENKYPFDIDYWGWDTVSKYLKEYEHLLPDTEQALINIPKFLTKIPSVKLQQIYGIDKTLQEIDNELFNKEKESTPVVLYNIISGIGKTTTALAYAHSRIYQKKFDHTAHIDCTRDIRISFMRAFENNNINFNYKNRYTIYENFEFLITQLNRVEGTNLLIIDNITDYRQIDNIIDSLRQLKWKIIITSKYKIFNLKNIKINSLSLAHAKKLFKFYNKDLYEDEILEKILKKINFHPFLTKFFAKNVKFYNDLTIKELYKILKDKDTKIHHLKNYITFEASKNEVEWQRQILTYIIAIYEYQLYDNSRKEKQLLTQLTCFPCNNFTFNEISEALYLGDKEQNSYSNRIINLISKNWVNANKNNLNVQTYVKSILHKKLKPTVKKLNQLLKNLNENLAYALNNDEIDFSDIIYAEELLLNLKNDNRLSASLAYNLAIIYENMGYYDKAQEHFTFAVEIEEQYFDESEPDDKLTENISQIYFKTHNLQKALHYGKITLSIRKHKYEEDSPIIAQTYRAIALIYDKMKIYEKAIEYIDNSLDIYQEIYDDDNDELQGTKKIHNYLSRQYEEAERRKNRKYWFNKYF